MTLHHKSMIHPVLCFMPELGTGETPITPCIGKRRFGRITQQKRMGHLPCKPRVLRQRVDHVIGHVLEKNRPGLRLVPDHCADVFIRAWVAWLGREIRKQPVGTGQVVVIHEGFVQYLQIPAFAHDAFKRCRDRTRMAPEGMNVHAMKLDASCLNGQRRIT